MEIIKIIKLCMVCSHTVRLFTKETDNLLYKGDS